MEKLTINAQMFKDMILNAASYLEQNKAVLNDLNVFPVPDGDTGTNMSMTMISAAREVSALPQPTVGKIASALSMGALKGARGNSGVILSQLFRGFALSIEKSKQELDVRDFAGALKAGIDCAYKAVMKPKEGTVLTVARAMAEKAMAEAEETENVIELLDAIITEGNAVLLKTPEMLPVLKEAGVVDAGGAGLLVIYKGFKMSLDGEEITSELDFSIPSKTAPAKDVVESDIEFGYCTEFFIKNIKEHVTQETIDTYRERLMLIGDCVLVVGDLELIKTHVHTNNPGRALQYALKLGDLSGIKIDNMREQHNEILFAEEEKNLKEMGVIVVSAGEGLADIFREFEVDAIVEGGQSMNPSIEDILDAIKKIPAKNVFVLPNNKNIILAAEQAAELTDQNVIVIPSKSFPQGLSAVLSFNSELSVEENKDAMIDAIGSVKSGAITFAVRDTKLNGEEIKEHEILGLFDGDIVVHGDQMNEIIIDLLNKMVTEDDSVISAYYGSDISEEEAEILREKLEETFQDYDIEVYGGKQPVYQYILSVE